MNSNTVRKGRPSPPGQGKSAAAKRRRARREAKLSQQPRRQTVAVVPRQRRMDSFVHCAIDPFTHKGPLTGVPDRFAGLSIVAESKTIKDFEVNGTSQWTYLLITPQIGVNLWYLQTASEQDYMSTNQASWTAVDPTLKGDFQDQMQEFRTISLAVKVTYTGNPAIANGVVTASRVPIITDVYTERTFALQKEIETEHQSLGEPYQYVEVPVGGGNDTYTDPLIQCLDFSLATTDLLAQPDSVSLPLAVGAYATSSRIGGDSWNFQPAAVAGSYPVVTFKDLTSATNIKSDAVFAVVTTSVGKQGTQFPTIDKEWYSLLVCVRASSNSYFGNPSFRVEVRHCAEYVPSLAKNSALLRSISRQSPPHKPAALNQVARIQRQLPAAIPSSQSWLDWLAHTAGRVLGNVARGAAGPAIEAVTQGLSAMGLGSRNNFPALTY